MAATRKRSFLTIILGVTSILLLFALWSFREHVSSCSAILSSTVFTGGDCKTVNQPSNRSHDPLNPTFYDEPETSYEVDGKPIKNWDHKRKQWLNHHPSFAGNSKNRVFVLSGTQPAPCKNPIGDYLLMRTFKNKVDYCRIHGYEFFYNTAVLQPKMDFCWAKIPMVRALMLAHPETEWILWMDSDSMFTDMDFKVPLEKYKNHNFVVVGYPEKIFKQKTWLSINAGVFLIRNCQWSLDLLDVWASIGPISPDFDQWGKTLSETLNERVYEISDDQSALVYIMLTQKEKWMDKIFIENSFWSLNSYWLDVVDKFENITKRYEEIQRNVSVLRRRHAEVVTEAYSEIWEEYLRKGAEESGENLIWFRRPYITHFAGCQPCSGDHNKKYKGDACWKGMERTLNFADNQVLRSFGFFRPDLGNVSNVSPLPFDFPVDDSELEALV